MADPVKKEKKTNPKQNKKKGDFAGDIARNILDQTRRRPPLSSASHQILT